MAVGVEVELAEFGAEAEVAVGVEMVEPLCLELDRFAGMGGAGIASAIRWKMVAQTADLGALRVMSRKGR